MLASANIGVIWGIFIIISIVAQIIKGRKQVADQAPGGPASRRETDKESSTEDELRQFLENLGGVRPQPIAPPEPVMQRQEQRRTFRPDPHPQPKPKEPARRTPPPAPIITQPVVTPPKAKVTPVVELEPLVTPDENSLQNLIRKELQQTDATRKAIILREILGPPIALRRREKRL